MMRLSLFYLILMSVFPIFLWASATMEMKDSKSLEQRLNRQRIEQTQKYIKRCQKLLNDQKKMSWKEKEKAYQNTQELIPLILKRKKVEGKDRDILLSLKKRNSEEFEKSLQQILKKFSSRLVKSPKRHNAISINSKVPKLIHITI